MTKCSAKVLGPNGYCICVRHHVPQYGAKVYHECRHGKLWYDVRGKETL